MCGRYSASKDARELQEEFMLEWLRAEPERSYNLAPTRRVPVISDDDPAALNAFRWGLIPSWAKDKSIGSRLINARAETLAEKPAFRDSLASRRCLVLADGFYEWKQAAGRKAPYFIRLKTGRSMVFAGLWDLWRHGAEELRTCTIVTTAPNQAMTPFHDRMPAILDAEAARRWLSQGEGTERLLELLKPCPDDALEIYPVSAFVNSVKNDGPECIRPADPAPTQGLLF